MTGKEETMQVKSREFKALDALYIAISVIPLLLAMVLKVLTAPATEGISITGARIYFTLKLPLQDLPITEAQVNSWLLVISLLGLCLYLTHGLSVRAQTKRQLALEWAFDQVKGLVSANMGESFFSFIPFVGAILVLSMFSSLMSLLGLFPPTSDLNVVAGWAVLVFILITYYKLKGGPLNYLKGFAEPIPLVTPFNIISEVATPVSMAFRHYGNVLSGVIVSALLAFALQNLSKLVLGWLPGFLGEFPFLQIGIPALFSVYFDLFSGFLQAYIFAVLTMLYISEGYPRQAHEMRMKRKADKKEKNKNV